MGRKLLAAVAVATVALGGGTTTALAAHHARPTITVTPAPVDLGSSPPTYGTTTTTLQCTDADITLTQTGWSWNATLTDATAPDGTPPQDSTFAGTDTYSYKHKHVKLTQDSETHYVELTYYSDISFFVGSGPIPPGYGTGVSTWYVSNANISISQEQVFPSNPGTDMCAVFGLGYGLP